MKKLFYVVIVGILGLILQTQTANATKATATACTRLLNSKDPIKELRPGLTGYFYYAHENLQHVLKDRAKNDVALFYNVLFDVLRLSDSPIEKGPFCFKERKFLEQLGEEIREKKGIREKLRESFTKADLAGDCINLLNAACQEPGRFVVPPKAIDPSVPKSKLEHILRELFDTEDNYLTQLKAIEPGVAVIRQAVSEFIPPQPVKRRLKELFTNLKIIGDASAQLLASVSVVRKSHDVAKQVALIPNFINYFEATKAAYRNYRKSYEGFHRAAQAIKDEEKKFLDHLDKIFILPIQRAPRYIDLLAGVAASLAGAEKIKVERVAAAARDLAHVMNFKDYFYLSDFDLATAKDTGGVTGSKKVRGTDRKDYQLKPSILDAEFTRKVKANGLETENFGEAIAAEVLRAITESETALEIIPKVMLVYDHDRKRVGIASRYLLNVKGGTLDDYAKRIQGIQIKGKHVRVSGNPNPAAGTLTISGDANVLLRQDLAEAMAVSDLVGDHDVNPGNMIVFEDIKGFVRVARIDFGHAFNDLIYASAAIGGGFYNRENRILDFLNREKVAHLDISQQTSKLWRDYEGITVSQEFADAFKKIANSPNLAQGIRNAKAPFAALLNDLEKDKGEHIDVITHVKSSLLGIVSKISDSAIKREQPTAKLLDDIFQEIETFMRIGMQQMNEVADLIALQHAVKQAVAKARGLNRESLDLAVVAKLKQDYEKVATYKGIGQPGRDQIEWVKEIGSELAFRGNLTAYINYCFSKGR